MRVSTRVARILGATAVFALACAAPTPVGALDASQERLASILERYNAAIDLATQSVDSLRVVQHMVEPQPDGGERSARAVLVYERSRGMTRRVITSNLSYPAGDYTLASLVGPGLDPSEYRIVLEAEEDVEGVPCYRLGVTALSRDVSHIDGTVWISRESPGPVRVVGLVADPPFPLAEIRLDKRFGPGPLGFAVLRCHAGEVRAGIVLGRKKGARTITYAGYVVNGVAEE